LPLSHSLCFLIASCFGLLPLYKTRESFSCTAFSVSCTRGLGPGRGCLFTTLYMRLLVFQHIVCGCRHACTGPVAAVVVERRPGRLPRIPIGLFVGESLSSLTLGPHCRVLVLVSRCLLPTALLAPRRSVWALASVAGGSSMGTCVAGSARKAGRVLALVVLLVHVPIAALEERMLGFRRLFAGPTSNH